MRLWLEVHARGNRVMRMGAVILWVGVFGGACTKKHAPPPPGPTPSPGGPVTSPSEAPPVVTTPPAVAAPATATAVVPPPPPPKPVLVVGDTSVSGQMGEGLYQSLTPFAAKESLFLYGACGTNASYWAGNKQLTKPPCGVLKILEGVKVFGQTPFQLGTLVERLKPRMVILSLGIQDNEKTQKEITSAYKNLLSPLAALGVAHCHVHGPWDVTHPSVRPNLSKIYKGLEAAVVGTPCTLFAMNKKPKTGQDNSVYIKSTAADGIGITYSSKEAKLWMDFVVKKAGYVLTQSATSPTTPPSGGLP